MKRGRIDNKGLRLSDRQETIRVLRNKRCLSPVIATVLLIVLVVAIASIISIWAFSFVKEAIQKQGRPAEQVCADVNLEASISNGKLLITNNGNVPVYSLNLVMISAGSKDAEKVEKIQLSPGKSYTKDVSVSQVEITPIILGEGKSGQKEYICENNKKVVGE